MSAPDNIGGDKSVAAKITHVKATIDGIKLAPVSAPGSSGVQQSQQQTTAAFRTIASSGQSTQVRVVMPPGTLMPQSMLKQIEGTGRTQITAIPARTVSNTSITVTRPVTQTTYLPRAGVTSTSMQGQRLVTPIRAQATPVAGLSGNFVRGTTVTRNTSSPATTVISPATTTWMANNGGQVQLIRAINHQPRQRLITQNISTSGVGAGGGAGGVVSVSSQSTQGNQQVGNQSNLQTVSSQQAQQTFVATLATVLPRQQTATLVYTNVSNSQSQQYNPAVNTTQRFAAAPLANTQRQIRPIPMNKSFSTTKLGVGMNTTSISIRAPNLPLLNTTLNSANAPGSAGPGGSGGLGTGVTPAGGTIQSRGTSGNTNIPTTRIIQLQQQPGGATQQIIGSTGRIANNLMLQPIIVNTSGGGKIGLRPPATMATKVQPSLTITQLGISKLPPNAQQQTSSSASIQCASVSTASAGNTNVVTSSAVGVPSIMSQQSQQQTVNVNSQSPITQIVNVSQNLGGGATGQLLTTQNVSTAATVVPLAITSRGNNVISGTITPIKSAGLTVGKMMAQQSSVTQHQSQSSTQSGQMTEIITSTQQHHSQQQPTSVFIHHSRPHSGGNASGVGGGSGGSTAAVIPSTGTSFLPPGSTFYYESVPASSVTVSTGVLSLTTTTVTNSTMSNSQIVTSSNLAPGIVTSLPFNAPSSATFTVVPSSNRAIGQLQIPVSSTSAQIQAVPVRFTTQIPTEQGITTSAGQQGQTNQQTHHQIIIPSQAAAAVAAQQSQSQQQQQSQGHMVIPLPTSIKVTSGNSAISSSAFLRKRDNDGSPIRAAKNLGPTLLSMGGASSTSSVSSQQMSSSTATTADSKKEQRAVSPASSDGSTTVSANSSPGVDQQINEELTPVNRMPNESHFNPINDMYPNHQNSAPTATRDHSVQQSNQSHLNGAIDCPPRKKSRRSTNDSQQSTQSHASSLPSINPPTSNSSAASNVNGTTISNAGAAPSATGSGIATSTEPPKVNNNNQSININSNKENTKPTEFVIRKPRSCTLLNSYKQNWKAANNHFQRHSDVKPREERRPTVMDLANQANVLGKINGWKVHHLKSQMEDLCESESKGYEKLTVMLNQMESHGKNTDIERISDLIKGNMQRSKIIVDGITEAQNQIMKIFDHKSHISDIIHRCASKRNFKKREKA